MKALDIVRLDDGSMGIIKEGNKHACSIKWFGYSENKTAWWHEGELGLSVVDSLPALLCDVMRHQFSSCKSNPYRQASESVE